MADKRQLIIEAAQQIFLENGIEKTKVSDIVKRASIAQGTFYLYFPTKFAVMPEIAKHVVIDILAFLQDKVNAKANSEEQLEEVVDAIMQFNLLHKERLQLLYAGLAQSEFIGQWEDIYEPFYTWMAQIIEQGQQQNKIHKSLEASATAKILIGTIESTAEQIYLFADVVEEVDVEQRIALLKQFIRNALGIQ
ncbi:TetR family transcriptional regulator [Solibacillus sp. R5-41]|uniref:TetR family transcriptional regulator n=1 Tax=Solibacillus sp. R5-41 TaxID=2048654 RepID=UPI000C1287EC|nr:TetR family transcriptional regulator [Solibacillus sp. R5-41]ATP38794.1 TetR family transcriptional regulator [Solibacillus sp. R5-41]